MGLRDVERLPNGHWRAAGAAPLIALRPADGGALLAGDVRFAMSLVPGERSPATQSTLVLDAGGGWERPLRIPLPAARAGRITAVVTLPPGTVGLALDPGEGSFEVREVTLDELSSARAFLAHAAPQVRRLARNPAQLLVMAARAARLLRNRGVSGVLTRLRQGTRRQSEDSDYVQWAARYAVLSEARRAELEAGVARLSVQPLVSVLLAPGTSGMALQRTWEALVRQLYPHWELVLGTEDLAEEMRLLFEPMVATGRMRLIAPHAVLADARGTVVVRLRAGDVLAEDALFAAIQLFGTNPTVALVYSDEDLQAGGGERHAPAFKPDWSPELLRSRDYIGRAAFFRTERARQVGGWKSGPVEATQHDFLLSFTSGLDAEQVWHLPLVLLHASPAPPSSADVASAGLNMLQAFVDGAGASARVEPGLRPWTYHVRYKLPVPPPRVTVVIPTRDQLALLRRCIESVQQVTAYDSMELVVVDNDSRERKARAYLDTLERTGVARVLRYPHRFNYSAINNLAVKATSGEVLCFLNNDVEAFSADWLAEMVGVSLQPGVGAVGAKLVYPNGTLQHAGVVAGLFGVGAHPYVRQPRTDDGYLLQLQVRREVAAVTAACMVVRRDRFLEVGGFDDAQLQVAFSDFDFCFKLLRAGYRNVWTPHAELRHVESASRGVDEQRADRKRFLVEESVMRDRWRDVLERDPYYSPNLSLDTNVPRPAWPPRVAWPRQGAS